MESLFGGDYVNTSRDEILEFLRDISGPVGPEVFAGFGSNIQDQYASAGSDLGAMMTVDDSIKNTWVNNVDVESAIRGLLSIVVTPPNHDWCNGFYYRFRDNWDYNIVDLLGRLREVDRIVFETVKREFSHNADVASLLREIE